MDCKPKDSTNLPHPAGTSLDMHLYASTFYASQALVLSPLPPVVPTSHPQPAITHVGLHRVFQSLASLKCEDPLPPPPATGSLTPPQPSDPLTLPWLHAPSSPPWSVFPLAALGSLVPMAPPWSLVDNPLPRDYTSPASPRLYIPPALSGSFFPPALPSSSGTPSPQWSSGTVSLPQSLEPAATPWPSGSSVSPRLCVCLALSGSPSAASSQELVSLVPLP
ncbi:hypothetical protein M9458_008325, partial [Cirrhinus mrigala]